MISLLRFAKGPQAAAAPRLDELKNKAVMIPISNPSDETKVGVRQPEFDRPLIVDLDETLLRTDLLLESLFAYLSTNPLRAAKVLGSLSRGRALLKADVARETSIDVAFEFPICVVLMVFWVPLIESAEELLAPA